MKPTSAGLAAISWAALLFCGCQDADAPQVGTAPSESEPPSSAEVPIRLARWDEVERLIAAQQGKVVVLDVWSTWCPPCVREFPQFVALHRQHGGRVACVSLNCNYTGADDETPEDSRAEVAAFLEKQQANFENVISATPDEELLEKLDAAAVPIVRVYDQRGELRKQFVNDDNEYGEDGFTYEQHVGPLVEQLLAE